MIPATHSSTPNRESEDGEAQGPPGPKAQDHQHDPGWLSEFIDPCCDGHGELPLPQAVIALSMNIAPIRYADSKKSSANLRSSCSDCALPRTGPNSTNSWLSGATVRTLHNRNPSRKAKYHPQGAG